MTPDEMQAYVGVASKALGLKLTDEQRPGVLAFFAIAAGFAKTIEDVPLVAHDESAVVFHPVEMHK